MRSGIVSVLQNMNIKILFLKFALGTIFLTAVFSIILALPLRTSVVFAAIISMFVDLAYILHKKRIFKRKEIKIQNYWPKIAIKELITLSLSTIFFLCLGINILKAFGLASFFYIVVYIYYNTTSVFIRFSGKDFVVRRSLCFISLFGGWHYLMELNLLFSAILSIITLLILESDRRVTEKLYNLNKISVEDIRRSSETILMAPGLVLGMIIGYTLSGEIGSWTEAIPKAFKLYPIIILFWYSIFQPVHWLRVYLHERII